MVHRFEFRYPLSITNIIRAYVLINCPRSSAMLPVYNSQCFDIPSLSLFVARHVDFVDARSPFYSQFLSPWIYCHHYTNAQFRTFFPPRAIEHGDRVDQPRSPSQGGRRIAGSGEAQRNVEVWSVNGPSKSRGSAPNGHLNLFSEKVDKLLWQGIQTGTRRVLVCAFTTKGATKRQARSTEGFR